MCTVKSPLSTPSSLSHSWPPHCTLRPEMLPEMMLISGWCTMAASTPTSAGATAAPHLAQTYLVSDAPGLDGLVPACLDGSTPRYWFQPSSTMSTKWAIHMQGGGWCESLEDCARRAYSPSQCLIGSSSPQCFAPRGTVFNTSMDLVSRAQDDLQVPARVDQIILAQVTCFSDPSCIPVMHPLFCRNLCQSCESCLLGTW